jgi:hypothetical protein
MLVQYREALRDVADLEWAMPRSDPSTPMRDFQPAAESTPTTLLTPSSPDSSQSSSELLFPIGIVANLVFCS